jgi:chorismate dehydratase
VRVGRIPYLNSEPFYAGLTGHALVALPPRALGQAVADGRIDAGPLSLVDFFRLEAALTPLPLGIATAGPARSVVLFSRRPVKELDGAVIGVTGETSTSVQVLRLLLTARHGVEPRAWVPADQAADAVLLIGDQALRALATPGSGPHRLDVGQEWFEWTGLPCVFARWAVRAAIARSEREGLALALDRALDRGLASLASIAEQRQDVGLDRRGVETYLRGFTYRFGPEEDRAIGELRGRLAGVGPPPGAWPP